MRTVPRAARVLDLDSSTLECALHVHMYRVRVVCCVCGVCVEYVWSEHSEIRRAGHQIMVSHMRESAGGPRARGRAPRARRLRPRPLEWRSNDGVSGAQTDTRAGGACAVWQCGWINKFTVSGI